MGLTILLLGLVVFLGAHTFVTLRDARGAAIARLGHGPYMGLFALTSLVGVVLIGWGFALYRRTGWIDVWHPPDVMRHVTVGLMWPAVILVTAAYLPGHIKRAVKHPMLAGVKLWAFAHLLANGDLGSIVLFGAILAWAVYDRIAVKRRTAAENAAAADAPDGWTNDIIAVLLGTFLYAALGLLFHPLVIGVPVFGR